MRTPLLLLLLVSLLAASEACKSSSSSPPRPPRVERRREEASSEDDDDDSPDETAEDAVMEEEDFDLICDNHVVPNRTRRLPDVVIFGARKGGTRALLEFLKIHPMVKSSGPEIHYFDNHYARGSDWYVSQMVPVEEGQLCAEKTPGYFHHPEAARRAAATIPSARLLLIVRDPVKRLVSDYNQFRTRNLDRGRDYPPLESLVLTEDGTVDASYPPLQRSVYHQHLSRWLDHFPKEQIHVVHGDRFIREPWEELAGVEEFLGIPPAIQRDNFYFNSTKGFYCMQQRRSKGIWECTMKKCLSKSKGRPKPKVEDGALRKLENFFREHNRIFNEMVGRDFGWST